MANESVEPTMAETMTEAVAEGETVEAVCHCERPGSLATDREEWHQYDSLAALPERPLGGWEELVVFTDERVYRQMGVGYDGGVTATPRTPAALVEGETAASAATARADDD